MRDAKTTGPAGAGRRRIEVVAGELSSLFGTAVAPKRGKLKATGTPGVFTDGAGNFFPNSTGDGPAFSSAKAAAASMKGNEGEQAAAGAKGTAAEAFGVEKATGTAGWGVGEKPAEPTMGGGVEPKAEDKSGLSAEDKQQADSVYSHYGLDFTDKGEFYKAWKKMSPEQRQRWIDGMKSAAPAGGAQQ